MKWGNHLVHISTDFVFDGAKSDHEDWWRAVMDGSCRSWIEQHYEQPG